MMAAASWFIAIAPLSSYGESIHGRVSDGTPDYSEFRFQRLERVMASFNPEKSRDDQENQAVMEALMPFIETRTPIANVTVILRHKTTVAGGREFLVKSVTDSQGKFTFSDTPRGEYSVTAELKRRWWTRPVQIRKEVEHYHSSDFVELVYYSAAAIVKGKITDTVGRPIASAKVTATDYSHNQETSQEDAVHSHVVSTRSASDGSYELAGLIPGNAYSGPATYDIHAEKEGFVTTKMRVPVATECVYSAHTRLIQLLLESQGRTGKARLEEWKRETHLQPSRKGNTQCGINLSLGTPSVLSGRVSDPQNRPMSGCEVWLAPVKDRWRPLVQDAPDPKRICTDEGGAFECRGIPAGQYKIHVGKDDRWIIAGSTNFIVGEDQVVTGMNLQIDFHPLGRIEATVRKRDGGGPIPNFAATVRQVVSPNEYYSTTGTVKLNSAGRGTFSVENISPGKAELEITAPGFAPEHLTIDIPSGQTAPLHIQMTRSGTAAARVIRDNAPLQHSENLQAFSEETNTVTYGRNGRPEIPELKPGGYIIRAHVFEGDKCIRYETAPILIEADKTNNVTLDFSGNNTLAFSLAMPSDLSAQIWVESSGAPMNQPFEKNLGIVADLWLDWPGIYEVKHLRPGTYRVYAQLIDPEKGNAANTKLLPKQVQTVTLKEGKAVAVDFRF
jgi:protocatechuate 3,4-dioxygenase beta subunit